MNGFLIVLFNLDYGKTIDSFVRQDGRIAIVGLGNDYRTDDGAGTAVIRLLKESAIDKVDEVALFEADRNLVGYLSDIEKFQPSRIIFVDAANLGTEPGKIMVLDEKQIVEKRISTHENNLDLALAYFKIVLPEHEVLFVGIQFKSLEMTDELTLTEETRRAVEELVRLITDAVSKK
jgi:hydrogenase 3 maturation protease